MTLTYICLPIRHVTGGKEEEVNLAAMRHEAIQYIITASANKTFSVDLRHPKTKADNFLLELGKISAEIGAESS